MADRNKKDDDNIIEVCSKASDISFIDNSFIDDESVQTSSNLNFKNVNRSVESALEDAFSKSKSKKDDDDEFYSYYKLDEVE